MKYIRSLRCPIKYKTLVVTADTTTSVVTADTTERIYYYKRISSLIYLPKIIYLRSKQAAELLKNKDRYSIFRIKIVSYL